MSNKKAFKELVDKATVADTLPATQYGDFQAQLIDLGEAPSQTELHCRVSMSDEMERAVEVKHRTRELVGNMMEDVRLGKPISVGPVREVAQELTESMFRNKDAILSLSLLKEKDEYTYMHSVNVGVFLISFCNTLGVDPATTIEAGIGGILHDIGKMRTSPEVLNKEGKLTDEEFNEMRMHVTHGYNILKGSDEIPEIAKNICYEHHERWDGSGYPRGLKGDEISRFGLMAAIVDVYDAITSDRCYHKGMNPHVALQKMTEWSAYHFNKELFFQFVQCVGIYPTGSLVRLKNDLIGVVMHNHPKSLLHPVVNIIIDAKKRTKLKPRQVDLMAMQKQDPDYVIAEHELPKKWGVNPRMFVTQP
ncbi:MAG: HD-GYP domain-containing protein [Magnetococcales bacterium]|nr:HD-GYP domain-containing protein [Magnetococcales bacterium]